MSEEQAEQQETTEEQAKGTQEQGAQESSTEGKTFTQEDVNKLMSERLAKQEQSFLKKFGFQDSEKMSDALKQYQADQEAKLTTTEKLTKQAEEAAGLLESERSARIQAETKVEALSMGVDPAKLETVQKLAQAYEGETTADKVKALLEDVPGLKLAEKPKGTDFGGGSGGKQVDKNESLGAAAYAAAMGAAGIKH